MQHNQQDKTLALAGVYQSVILIQEIARTGSVADVQVAAMLETLFRFDANNVMDVYGDISSVKKGLQLLVDQLSGKGKNTDLEITRYAINLLHLEKALSKSANKLDKIADELSSTQSKIEYFHVAHENIIASLAEIYKQDISPLGSKIMIQGEEVYLSQQNNANKIRALLFAGIRSAVLWRQCGGSRLKLILFRKPYIETAQQLLKQI